MDEIPNPVRGIIKMPATTDKMERYKDLKNWTFPVTI